MDTPQPQDSPSSVSGRPAFWIALASLVLNLALTGWLVLLAREVRQLRQDTVQFHQPFMIHNRAYDTVLDAFDPAKTPGPHRDDRRKGAGVQQWPAHGGRQHIWELIPPAGPAWQSGTN